MVRRDTAVSRRIATRGAVLHDANRPWTAWTSSLRGPGPEPTDLSGWAVLQERRILWPSAELGVSMPGTAEPPSEPHKGPESKEYFMAIRMVTLPREPAKRKARLVRSEPGRPEPGPA